MFHPFYNWHSHQIFFFYLKNAIWLCGLCFFTPVFFCFHKCTKSLALCSDFLLPIDTPITSVLDLIEASICQKSSLPGRDPQQGEATDTMFCTKLKDLKITGECPFSLLAPGQVPKEPAEEVAGSAESCPATLPICQDAPEKKVQGSLPQRKTSRSRVYLHTLAESICKLIFPEVSACPVQDFTDVLKIVK